MSALPVSGSGVLDEGNLVDGSRIVGGAVLVEFLSDGSPCITF